MTFQRFTFAHYSRLIGATILLLSTTQLFGQEIAARIDYLVEIDPDLNRATGKICGDNLKRTAFRLNGTMQWRADHNATKLPNDSCLRYKLRLDTQKGDGHFKPSAKSTLVLTSLDKLLPCTRWRNGREREVSRFVSFKLATGIQISMPGKAISETDFSLLSRPCDWSSGVLLGELANTTIHAFGSSINIVMPAALTTIQQKKITRWLSSGINSLARAYNTLPVDNFRILVLPTGPNREAVPWGQVMRGGGDSVHLYVDETKTLEELKADWVLVHELSHLLHPYLKGGDSWLAEGIASYYQNVLRAREGLLDQEQAWENLHAGFQRGLKQFEPQMTLENDTRQLMRERKYMRVYWSGAAIALLADVQLRTESKGSLSLDLVLKQISQCCLPTVERRMRAYELMQTLDEISNSVVFSRLYKDYVARAKFPSLDAAYQTLGITRTGEGLQFDATPHALHKRIMVPR